MSIIEKENISGCTFIANSETVCIDCLTEEEWSNLTENEILLQDSLEESEAVYFCDRCKKRLV